MDKKELLQQLMNMKKEYAQKCKRLQLAVRAKNSREHVRKKILDQNELSADEGSFQEESFNGSLSSPIVLSSEEKTFNLTLSNSTPKNADSPGNEQLQSENSHSVNSMKQKPTLVKNTNENVLQCSLSKETTMTIGLNYFEDCNKNIEKYESPSTEKQIEQNIGSAKQEKISIHTDETLTKSEIGDSSHLSQNPQKKNIDNLNSGQSTESSESSGLSTKPKTADFDSNDFDFSSSPPTIRRKRKHSASHRDILPRTTPSNIQLHCDINQSTVQPKPRRRSYKKEEQNVILLSVIDYIVEEGKRDASFKEFQLPDSEFAKIKTKHQNKNNSSKASCKKAENSSSRQSKRKQVGITKTFKENPDSKSESSLKKSPDKLKSSNLEELEHFQKPLANPVENLQNSVAECVINTNSCKSVSQNLLNSVDLGGAKNIQECLLENESADTPKRIPNHSIDSKTKNYHVDVRHLANSKVPKKCLPFTKTDPVKNPKSLTLNHRCSVESQDLSDSLDRIFSRNTKKCLPKTVDVPRKLINNRTKDLEPKTCTVESQDLLDSVGLDDSFCDKVPLFPQCNDGLSQFSVDNSKSPTDIFLKNIDDCHLQAKGIPAASFSKNNNDHLHAKEDSSLQREIETHCLDSKTDFLSNNSYTDSCTRNDETILYNETILPKHSPAIQSQLTQDTKSTISETSCDKSSNKNVTQFETEKKDLKSSHHSISHPDVLQASRHDFDHLLPSNENISKGGDSRPKETSSLSLKVKTCVHNFSPSVCDRDKFNNKTFQDFKEAESFRLPGSNEEVVSLLNSRFCPSGYNDLTPMDLLVCVTQCSIYYWTLTILGQWDIVHQQQITELERCCQASLHPLQNGVGVATILVNTQGQSRLVLHTFQMQEDMEKKHLAVTSQKIHKLIYSSLNSCSMAVARISRDKTIDVCKYVFSEDLSSAENILTLDFLSEKLLSLSAVQGLPAALLGLTATNILLIWNHVANVLLTKISLSDILVKSCTLPSAFTDQGHIVFPLIFDDGPEQGCLLAVNPDTDVVVKLLSYQRHLIPETKSDTRMALILHEKLLSVQDNLLGIWDLYSGSLLACVNSLGMTCMTMVHCEKEILLVTGHKQSCLHIYRSQLQT